MAEKSQNDIFLETLKKLEQENVLKELILVGSWCLPIYKNMYGKNANILTLRTSDLDFLSYMKIAAKYAMETEYMGIKLKIPELSAFTLHKAIVQTLRKNETKKAKDAATVTNLGNFIAEFPELKIRTIQIFNKFPKSWQKIILEMVKIHSQKLNDILKA